MTTWRSRISCTRATWCARRTALVPRENPIFVVRTRSRRPDEKGRRPPRRASAPRLELAAARGEGRGSAHGGLERMIAGASADQLPRGSGRRPRRQRSKTERDGAASGGAGDVALGPPPQEGASSPERAGHAPDARASRAGGHARTRTVAMGGPPEAAYKGRRMWADGRPLPVRQHVAKAKRPPMAASAARTRRAERARSALTQQDTSRSLHSSRTPAKTGRARSG